MGHLTVERLTVRRLTCRKCGVGDQCWVCQYLSVYYVVSITLPCSTWYMGVVFNTDDCGVLFSVCEVWVMYWVWIR